jgi:hypothetical protein
MDDHHQVNSIIATSICECRGEGTEHKIAPEQAKQMAKCIIAALSDAAAVYGDTLRDLIAFQIVCCRSVM